MELCTFRSRLCATRIQPVVIAAIVSLSTVLIHGGCYNFAYVRGTGSQGSLSHYAALLNRNRARAMAMVYQEFKMRTVPSRGNGWEYFRTTSWEGYALFIKNPSMEIEEVRASVRKRIGAQEYEVQYYYKDVYGMVYNFIEEGYGRAVIDTRRRMILVEAPNGPEKNIMVGYVTRPKGPGRLF
ncbi:MAG: hypothetical protein JXA20_09050 [Spirochaetes bacterium]|nr:hypothetical protein [Spirochaetota bacterium]